MTTVAIDFGTSNTVISVIDPQKQVPTSLRFPHISRIFQQRRKDGEIVEMPVIPSLVFIQAGHQWILGQQVRAKRLGLRDSEKERLFKAFKRDLVADFQSPPRHLEGISYTPELVSERFYWRYGNSLITKILFLKKSFLRFPSKPLNAI